jgi:predicted metal-binding membrane protein
MSVSTLETILRRDRYVEAAALAILTALAWLYILWLAGDMRMGGMDMSGFRVVPAGAGIMVSAEDPWTPTEFPFVFAMWAVMMVGMMTPSAAPMILIYARVGRHAAMDGKPFAGTGWFVTGYLLAWMAFALVATAAQWALDRLLMLTPMMESTSGIFSGILLILAGLYQWTPLKEACLSECQSPLVFIQRHGGVRGTPSGAIQIGASHGAYCVGCCWALMGLLFVGGVMNLLWIAAISIFVLLEKLMPTSRALSRIAGVGFIAAGLWLLSTTLR